MENLTGDPLAAKVAANILTEIFKSCFKGFQKSTDWFGDKMTEHDFFGRAAKKYAQKFEERYNFIRVLGMNEPVPLRDIYVRVNILDKITSNKRITLDNLEQMYDRDQRSIGFTQKSISGTSAANELSKFIVLGKPGAGKSTYLKYLALYTLDGKSRNKHIPILVVLKDFSDSGKTLFNYIVEQFDICNFPEADMFVKRILENGKCQLLLDGLDEVSSKKQEKIIREINNFTDKYSKNYFIISCRIAAYNHWFTKYTDVELADFDKKQIETFIFNWFKDNVETAAVCWESIKKDRPILELASIPLLLTLLCLAFEQTLEFPKNRAELYKEALDALLKKWDSSRYIKRDQIYQDLSLKRKESLFSRIAEKTFKENKYFLPKRYLENQISNFIINIPTANASSLDIESEVILKAIEAQHGIFVERAKNIFSFSHLTFQEYYTAKYIVDNLNKKPLKNIVTKYLTNDRWREVFLLIAGMLDEADDFILLVSKQINNIIKEDELLALMRELNRIHLKPTPYPAALMKAMIIYNSLTKGGSGIRITDDVVDYDPELQFSREIVLKLFKCSNYIVSESDSTLNDQTRSKMRNLKRSIKRVKSNSEHLDLDSEMVISNIRSYKLKDFFKATILLIDCLSSEIYINKKNREDTLNLLWKI